MTRALHRARVVASLGLTNVHKALLLKQLVLRFLCAIPAHIGPLNRLCHPFGTFFQICLGLDSSGLTTSMLSQLLQVGGCDILKPKVYLYKRFGQLAVRMLMSNYPFPTVVHQRLICDFTLFGFVFGSTSLVQLQMGLIPEVRLF